MSIPRTHTGDNAQRASDALPPHNRDAERALLSVLLQRNERFADVLPLIQPNDFYTVGHQVIFRGMIALAEAGQAIDFIGLNAWLKDHSLLVEAGGDGYLTGLWDVANSTSTVSVRGHAELIRDAAKKRRLLRLGRKLSEQAERPGANTAEILGDALQELQELGDGAAEEDVRIITAGELLDSHPDLRPAVIDGLLRRAETGNLVAASKTNKSWLAMLLAFAVAFGWKFLDTFQCVQGQVLVIDNELHEETITSRLRQVASAMNVPYDEVRSRIHYLPLRGKLKDLHGIGRFLRRVKPGEYALIVLDAWYRSVPTGVSENENGPIAALYNLIDQLAGRLNAAWVNVHHSSKGGQADKAITDVGSGAGSQSRAVDAHVVLRPHAEEGVVVLEAALRSWPPVTGQCLRWNWPVWVNEPSLDSAALKNARGKAKPDANEVRAAKEKSDDGAILAAMDRLAARGRKIKPRRGAKSSAAAPPTMTQIRKEAGISSNERAVNALARLLAEGVIEEVPTKIASGIGGKVIREFVGYGRISVPK
jgi:hypothetical protein